MKKSFEEMTFDELKLYRREGLWRSSSILAGFVLGVAFSNGYDYLYKNNAAFRNSVNWVGDRIDDGINFAGKVAKNWITDNVRTIQTVGEAISDTWKVLNPFG